MALARLVVEIAGGVGFTVSVYCCVAVAGKVAESRTCTVKVAIVGGASKGLGRACAEVLAQEGAQVAVCSRRRPRD